MEFETEESCESSIDLLFLNDPTTLTMLASGY